MFDVLRMKLRALREAIDEHMKGEGFVYEKATRDSLEALQSIVVGLDSRVHALEQAAGIKGKRDKPDSERAQQQGKPEAPGGEAGQAQAGGGGGS